MSVANRSAGASRVIAVVTPPFPTAFSAHSDLAHRKNRIESNTRSRKPLQRFDTWSHRWKNW